MKKILSITLTTLTLALLACATPARAEVIDWVLYNSTTAAADAAIAVKPGGIPLNTANADAVTLHFRNAGSAARTAAVECWDPASAQTVTRDTITVPATSDASVYIDARASSVTAPPRYTVWPIKPCHRMTITAAAATGSMRTIVLKRTSK